MTYPYSEIFSHNLFLPISDQTFTKKKLFRWKFFLPSYAMQFLCQHGIMNLKFSQENFQDFQDFQDDRRIVLNKLEADLL